MSGATGPHDISRHAEGHGLKMMADGRAARPIRRRGPRVDEPVHGSIAATARRCEPLQKKSAESAGLAQNAKQQLEQ